MASIHRLLNALLWRLSYRTVAHTYPLGWTTEVNELPLAKARLLGALDLLALAWPRWLQRMRPYVARIQVRRVIKSTGEWHQESRQVDLDQAYLCAEHRTHADIASTLVHEFTHARLDAAGIPYNSAMKVRVERACIRQQLAFATRLPPSVEVQASIEDLQRQWEQAPEVWSDEAFDRRLEAAAHEVGLPAWLVRPLMWFRRRSASREGTA